VLAMGGGVTAAISGSGVRAPVSLRAVLIAWSVGAAATSAAVAASVAAVRVLRRCCTRGATAGVLRAKL
jgi:hypothetical protein